MALLFLLERNLAPTAKASAVPDVDRTTIRIHSARAWPEKIILDTSTGIVAAASSPLIAEAPSHTAGDALALADSPKPETKIIPAPRRNATRAADLRPNRTARSAASRRLYDRQVMDRHVMVGAF
ncbi:hypothetical protein LPJ38_08255 [Bradyrhizobium daqingense]|uniref:hypothetical protein n=1 Tax=Bradyrhizobium daqingense TaxID=993502 RepID=UPI0011A6C450|nr:hypothetical protein [Bradyrhizobium daqingense]UFS90714.1 hypothetical protein LPJ38_08255 [Bradyrhizobium daqingense]